MRYDESPAQLHTEVPTALAAVQCSTRLQPGEDGVQPYKTRRLTIATPNVRISALPWGASSSSACCSCLRP
jgi:hypothetical protein